MLARIKRFFHGPDKGRISGRENHRHITGGVFREVSIFNHNHMSYCDQLTRNHVPQLISVNRHLWSLVLPQNYFSLMQSQAYQDASQKLGVFIYCADILRNAQTRLANAPLQEAFDQKMSLYYQSYSSESKVDFPKIKHKDEMRIIHGNNLALRDPLFRYSHALYEYCIALNKFNDLLWESFNRDHLLHVAAAMAVACKPVELQINNRNNKENKKTSKTSKRATRKNDAGSRNLVVRADIEPMNAAHKHADLQIDGVRNNEKLSTIVKKDAEVEAFYNDRSSVRSDEEEYFTPPSTPSAIRR